MQQRRKSQPIECCLGPNGSSVLDRAGNSDTNVANEWRYYESDDKYLNIIEVDLKLDRDREQNLRCDVA